MPWSPLPEPPAGGPAEPPARVTVDGEVFEITTATERPGTYHYAWTSGPNQGYGFTSSSSDGAPSTAEDHEASIRSFLAQVDPETGYID